MRTLKLVVAYDGTEFHGWQVQPGQRTVQGALEQALTQALEEDVKIQGAGRTDAGVHARGQCASFSTSKRVPAAGLVRRLRRFLPADVRVVDAEDREEGFHARHSARGRRYAYRLLVKDDVLRARHAWLPAQPAWLPDRPLDAARLERATRVLEGEHDCSSFGSAGSSPANPRCRISRARWSRWEGGLAFDVVADHFLYHMVRTLVGTALKVSTAEHPDREMREIREARDRSAAGVTVPAQGLCLEQVFYPAPGEAR